MPATSATSSTQSADENVTSPIKSTTAFPSSQVIHFSTLSVDFFPSTSTSSSQRATLQLLERDVGSPTDFYAINLDLIIKPRSSSTQIEIPIDDFLAVRHVPNDSTLFLFAKGAKSLGCLYFPNGLDACQSFILALRTHATFRTLSDPHPNIAGTVYAVEAKPRMRRVAPTLMPLYFPQPQQSQQEQHEDDQFNALLSDLNISSSTAQQHQQHVRRRRRSDNVQSQLSSSNSSSSNQFTISLLSQFARVTKVARDVIDQVTTLIDEDQRKRQRQQENEPSINNTHQSAINSALDIHATITASTDSEADLPPRLTMDSTRGIPVHHAHAFNTETGKVIDARVVRHAIFMGGIESESESGSRRKLWPVLLGVFPWNTTETERMQSLNGKLKNEYEALKEKAQNMLRNAEEKANADTDVDGYDENSNNSNRDRDSRASKTHADALMIRDQIKKDVIRTDRTVSLFSSDSSPALTMMQTILNTYALVYNREISYCQGMSDFLAPIIYELSSPHNNTVYDETLMFWCFERLMRRMEANFRLDQSGMHTQLRMLKQIIRTADKELISFFNDTDPQFYSCFRWLVVRFKREVPFREISKLWEVFWTREVAHDELHVYTAAGLLLAHRQRILALERGAFDALLRYINDMSMRIDVDFALQQGEQCYRTFHQSVVDEEN